jgi:hypothetical protein
MKIYFLYCLLPIISLIASPANVPVIDGILGKDEWKGAREEQLGNGNKLLIKNEPGVLYIAMVNEKGFWAHAYLSDGNVVKVMHTSAALDAVQYSKVNSDWLTKDTFQYEMRDRIYNKEVEEKIRQYYETNGWVASNVNMGGGKIAEFKINTSEWKGPLYVACVMANNDMTFHSWPQNLKDDTILPRLVQGYTPDSLNFQPSRWEKIK